MLLEAPNHKRRRRLSVLNTPAEHDRLIETLRAYGKPVICAFKATGNYHRPIAWRLIEAGFDSEEQLDMQTVHRARDRLVGERTALATIPWWCNSARTATDACSTEDANKRVSYEFATSS